MVNHVREWEVCFEPFFEAFEDPFVHILKVYIIIGHCQGCANCNE